MSSFCQPHLNNLGLSLTSSSSNQTPLKATNLGRLKSSSKNADYFPLVKPNKLSWITNQRTGKWDRASAEVNNIVAIAEVLISTGFLSLKGTWMMEAETISKRS